MCCATACPSGASCMMCSGHGVCAMDGTQICKCDPGWTGELCGMPAASPSPAPVPVDHTTDYIIGGCAAATVLALGTAIIIRRGRQQQPAAYSALNV